MAEQPHNTPALPQQPGLRAFIVYDQLPAGCVAFEVPDNSSAPYLHAGDFVVIDPADREPCEGELFAITWKSDIRQLWQIVRMDLRAGRYGNGGVFAEGWRWFIGAVAARAPMTLAGHPAGPASRWADGPFGEDYCREICHGKVIGIFEADFRRQLATAN